MTPEQVLRAIRGATQLLDENGTERADAELIEFLEAEIDRLNEEDDS